MTKAQISALVSDFFARGGQVTLCPTRVALSTPQLDLKKLRAEQLSQNLAA